MVADDPQAASTKLQQILETGTPEVVKAAHDALVTAKGEREAMQRTDPVVFQAGGDAYRLEVSVADTDAFIPAFSTRLASLTEGLSDADPAWTEFAERFMVEFSRILHVFELDPEKTADASGGSKAPMAAARLQYLFTAEQRKLLMQFMESGVIPEHLFSGTEVGRTTSQQRVLMAAHILAKGRYQPGSFEQRVHAKACGHWAKIVTLYAGAVSAGKNVGTYGQFDPLGGVVLTQGRSTEVLPGRVDPKLQVAESTKQGKKHGKDAYRFAMASWETVLAVQPGDWIYIYNANESKSGNHSVVFSGWRGEEAGEAPRRYRPATVFDQGRPDQGGGESHLLLGEDFFLVGKEGTKPVTYIQRPDPGVAPITTADALSPMQSKESGTANDKFIKSRQVDLTKFTEWLRTENTELIAELDSIQGRLSSGQLALLTGANASKDAYELTCLYQRLSPLVHNSRMVAAEAEVSFGGDLQKKHEEAVRAQMVKMAPILAGIGIHTLEKHAAGAEAWVKDGLRTFLDKSASIAALNAEVKAVRDSARSRSEKARLVKELKARIAALKAEAKASGPAIKHLKMEVKALQAKEKGAQRKIGALELEEEALDEELPTPFGITSGTISGDRGTVVNGAFASIPAPWEKLRIGEGPEAR